MERYNGGKIVQSFLFKSNSKIDEIERKRTSNITTSNIRGCEDQEELSAGKKLNF